MESIAQRLSENNTILFLGSGFSLDAKNATGDSIPSAGKLGEELLKAIGTSPDEIAQITDPLTDIVDYCLSSENNSIVTVSKLRQLFSVTELKTWQQELISSFPWKRIYTTNFDNSVEIACTKKGKPISVLSAFSPFENPPAGSDTKCVIHINGVAADLTPKNIDSKIRLSGKSYASNEFSESKWAQLFSTDIAFCDSAVFIGFSIGDLDIGRILVSKLSKHKLHFFNGNSVSKMAQAKLGNFGQLHLLNGEEFVINLKRLMVGSSNSASSIALNCFVKCRPDATSISPDALMRRDLMIYGRTENNIIQSAIPGLQNYDYLVHRSIETEILTELENGSDVALLSALGNGKTILLKKLAFQLTNKGWAVYSLRNTLGNWLKEVEYICAQKGKVVVLVDGAADCMNILEALGQRRGGGVRFLISERTRRFEAQFTNSRLELLGITDIVEHEIDLLSIAEQEQLDDILVGAGLWGLQAALTRTQRLKFIRNQCRNEISSTLLHVVRSDDIANRIKTEMNLDRLDGADMQVLSVGVALSVFGFRVPLLDLGRLCGVAEINRFLKVSSEFRDRLYDVGGGEFKVNSKIFGQYFLRDLVSAPVVLDALARAIRNSVKLGIRLSEIEVEDDEEFRREDGFIRKANSFPAPMYVFRNIQQIVDVESVYEHVFAFFEEIKRNTRLADDPLFWLQYAIAKLFSGDRESAKKYLDNSYGIARRTGFRTFQIDNQYARWLLESAVSTGDPVEAYTAFDEAHGIIINQLSDHNHAHYPYRIAIQYRDYYLHHQHALDPNQVEYVVNAARAVLASTEFSQVEIGKKHWVDRCKRALNGLIEHSRVRRD